MIPFLSDWQQSRGRKPREDKSPVRGRSPRKHMPAPAIKASGSGQNNAAGASSASDLQLQL
eukprot:6941857-Alexandrium_andersonii.AAC.1